MPGPPNPETAHHGTRHDTGPTIAATVGPHQGAWNNGVFAGAPELTTWARDMANAHTTTTLHGIPLTADATTPFGALAALASYSPGRTIITEAPNDVLELLVRHPDPDSEPQPESD